MNKNKLIIIMAAFSVSAIAEQEEYKPILKIEEVVVTAQRRSQDVRDVPIAITVLAGADMRDKAISDLTDMAHLLPNVSINTDYNAVYMRGIGTAELNVIGEQAVAYILDDVYVPRLDFLKPGFLDLAQVEVMKGPQGTLYGRNATGGVIKIEHGTPSQEWEGYLSAERGDRDLRSYEMALGGPISDNWSFRIAGRKSNDGGFVENTVTGENSREKDIEQARFSIRGDLSDKLTWFQI